MTYSGNKASNSEILRIGKDSDAPLLLTSVSFSVQYVVLNKAQTYLLESPFDGFVNILYARSKDNTVITYLLDQESFAISNGECVLQPIQKGNKLIWKNTNKNDSVIVIYIPNHIIDSLTTVSNQHLDCFKSGLFIKSDSRMQLITNKILDTCKQECNMLHLRMQALLIEAIVQQIESLTIRNEKQTIALRNDHYEKVSLAKKIIQEDLSKTFTISELAKLVGTNEQYLKKYFKQFFGKTVMNFSTDQKMNHAKELIMTGSYRVSDVARLTGYKHSTHFTTAFKKYFGFIPNSLRFSFLLVHSKAQELYIELEGLTNIF